MGRSSSLILCLLALLEALGCAGPAVREVPRYPPLSKPAKAADVEPAPSLVAMPLSCRPAEARVPNAIDDDCDGRIDDSTRDAALVVSIAFSAPVELELELRSADGHTVEPLAREPTQGCPHDASFRVLTREYDGLPDAPTELVVRQRGVCGAAENVTLAVGVSTPRGSRSYVGTLAPAEELVLARIAAP